MGMASPAKQVCLYFLLLTLSFQNTTHARDTQFFNKVPSSTTNQQQQQEDPTFVPDNENSYGLYGHESGQLPPSAITTGETQRPLSHYLPKNYNPVAYVTEPEDINDTGDTNTFSQDKTFTTTTNPYTTNYYNNGGRSYYNNQQDQDTDQYKTFSAATNNYYAGGSSFNSQPQGMSDTRLNGAAATSFNYGDGDTTGFRPQGMSDTRSLENGKYFYDVNTERYSTNHPYKSLKANARSRDVFGNGNNYGNAYEFNNGNSVNQDGFQDEQINYNLP